MTTLSFAERTAKILACLVQDHRIGGVLFLDLDGAELVRLAARLADALHQPPRPRPRVAAVTSSTTDDDLWVRTRIAVEREHVSLTLAPGLLVERPHEPPPVFVVPDLATAGLAVSRALVSVVGADVATAERHGRTQTWQPSARWLAACDRAAAGRLSPHVLDRFPVRIDAAEAGRLSTAELTELANHDGDPSDRSGDFAVIVPAVPRGSGQKPEFTAQAAHRVLAAVGRTTGARRDLAVARVARALSQIRQATVVSVEDVDDAGELLGFLTRAARPATSKRPGRVLSTPGAWNTTEPGLAHPIGNDSELPDLPRIVTPQPADERPEWLSVELPVESYPEDSPYRVTEVESLRWHWPRGSSRRELRGQVIGVRRTRDTRDLAIMATIVEAARSSAWRSGRRAPQAAGGVTERDRPAGTATGRAPIRISPSDLRRYRRRPEPTSLVVLVLDHSCHTRWDWTPAIAELLRPARYRRSALAVVEFGHTGASNELRATCYRCRTLLDPRVPASLNRAPGRASPLAYALDLAVNELRRALRRSRASVDDGLLVVVTDGRGNIPLDASIRGEIVGSVGRRGIEDAVEVAQAVREFSRTRAVVLAPAIEHCADLPFAVAEALGGSVATSEDTTAHTIRRSGEHDD